MRMTAIVALLGCILSHVEVQGQSTLIGMGPPIASLYGDDRVFTNSIDTAQALDLPHRRASGLTVPHHLVAADLIARAFTIAEGSDYDKIILISPDHLKRSRQPFATTRRTFETVFGPIQASVGDVDRLLAGSLLIEESDLFEKEHGIAALLPYVKHFFPGTPIIPITVSIGSTRDEWDQFVDDIGSLVTERTLIVQSTDFSHYLPLSDAIRRDQEVLNILSAADLDALTRLRQPQHLDSTGSQYIQMRLQMQHFGARPIVIANSNLQFYSRQEVAETTSYIVQLYLAQDEVPTVDGAGYIDGRMACFAGDTFFGRFMPPLLTKRAIRKRLLDHIQDRLNGCPLIVNLEGVMASELPSGLGPFTLAMPEELTLEWLRALNVVAVSLANNHAGDLGAGARTTMIEALEDAGIGVAVPGKILDFGSFRLVALTDLDNNASERTSLVTEEVLDRIMRSEARPPLVAFMHWGREFDNSPGSREEKLADALRQAAVSLIVGAHPHVASKDIIGLAGGETQLAYSLGNFLFDQPGDRPSGAVLEIRFFPQGTFFTRLLPIPNFYDLASKAH